MSAGRLSCPPNKSHITHGLT